MAPEEQFHLLFTIFSYLMLDFYVKTRIGFSLRDKRLFEITEVEITTVDCSLEQFLFFSHFSSPLITLLYTVFRMAHSEPSSGVKGKALYHYNLSN